MGKKKPPAVLPGASLLKFNKQVLTAVPRNGEGFPYHHETTA